MENEIKKNSFADAPTEVKPIHGILFVLACLALILSVALAVRRRNKPRWMWMTSLCSVGTLILMAAVMLMM